MSVDICSFILQDTGGYSADGNVNSPSISGIRLFIVRDGDSVYHPVFGASSALPYVLVGGLRANTAYHFRLRALNPVSFCANTSSGVLNLPSSYAHAEPLNLLSPRATFSTSSSSKPDPPSLKQGGTTGGSLLAVFTPPLDMGGVPLTSFTLHLNSGVLPPWSNFKETTQFALNEVLAPL